MSAVAERVAAGVTFLDEHDAPWWREDTANAINLALLDIANPRLCVLGQRCPLELGSSESPYAAQAALLGFVAEDLSGLWAWAVKLGFALDFEGDAELAAEWSTVIRERRSAVAG